MDEADKKLLNATIRYLSFRPRSEKEIRDYLKKKNANEKTIGLIVEKLKEYKFLDDAEFARRFIEQRIKIKPKAWRIIKLELIRKGISKEIIETIILEDQAPEINDGETALKLAEKRIERLKNEPRQKQYEKMFRYLASKGYNYDIIKEVVDRILPR